MAVLYAQTTQNNFSNFNDNDATDNYAWQFVPTASGTPTNMVLSLQGVSGSPVCNFYIRANRTAASTTYATATSVSLTSGNNTITWSGASQINSGTTYWIYMAVTTNLAVGYPQIQYDTAKNNYQIYRSSASNIDPDTFWQTNDVKMTINGTLASTANPAFLLNFV